jgi:hypothetical protein
MRPIAPRLADSSEFGTCGKSLLVISSSFAWALIGLILSMIFERVNRRQGPELRDTIQHATHKTRNISAENVPQ